MNKREQEALLKRLEELEKFKYRIELGSYWVRCLLYVVGGVMIFLTINVPTIIKDWVSLFTK